MDREYKSVKVREIWIGNLPNATIYDTIYNNFFIYGEISKIELHQERVITVLNRIIVLSSIGSAVQQVGLTKKQKI